jgi:hypothetical protein
MSNKSPTKEIPLDGVGLIEKQARDAFRKGRMSKSYALYSEAIALLERDWQAIQTQSVGLRLGALYTSGCYPAWRKSSARGTPISERPLWRSRGAQLERQGADISIVAARLPGSMTDNELVGVICHLHNLATELIGQRHGNEVVTSLDDAEHYINESYSIIEHVRPGDTMPSGLNFSFDRLRAIIAFQRGQYEKALGMIEPVIAHEQERVDKARRRKKKLPPPNWLKGLTEMRQQILDAIASGVS